MLYYDIILYNIILYYIIYTICVVICCIYHIWNVYFVYIIYIFKYQLCEILIIFFMGCSVIVGHYDILPCAASLKSLQGLGVRLYFF